MILNRTMGNAITIQNISKSFGSLKALDKVSFDIAEGTFHAIMGENGAGKSTIAKCIMGHHAVEEGALLVHDQVIHISSPRDAHRHGIGMVYQHFMLVDNMTVAENLTLARAEMPMIIRWTKENEHLAKFMRRMPFHLDLTRYVRDLSAGEKQKLEILKMLYINSRVLILDEPTSVLTPGEADAVLGYLKRMVTEQKLTVIIITHKFREVFGYADTVSVLRKGKYVGGGKVSDLSKPDIAAMMIGNLESRTLSRNPSIDTNTKLRLVELHDLDLTGVTVLNGLSLTVKEGEIYGIAGVSGNGQKRLVEILAGQRTQRSGEVLVNDQPFIPTRQTIRRTRFYCLPEEPMKNACIPDMSVAENLALRYYDESPFQLNGIILQGNLVRKATELIQQFSIRTPSASTPIRALSGGNVQRVVLARELSSNAAVLVISNPCFGLDFRATAEVRSLIIQARNRGSAVLLISEDLDEVIELSDRIGVMYNGRIVHEVESSEADSKIIGEKMAGN